MTQEEKQLLLKDICARVPYGVVVSKKPINESFTWKELQDFQEGKIYKPYLRPMSSMTEEERKELSKYVNSVQRTDFFYSHHIDCRFMIEKGLAIEAPEDMYKAK